MAIALVQSALGGHATTTSNSASCTGSFTNPTTAGNLLVAVGWVTVTGASPTINPTFSTPSLTWNQGSIAAFGSDGTTWKGVAFIGYVQNAPSISAATLTTLTSTFSGSFGTKTIEFALFEFSGVSTGAVVLDNSNFASGSASTPNPGNLATTAVDLLLSAHVGETGLISAGSGFTLGVRSYLD